MIFTWLVYGSLILVFFGLGLLLLSFGRVFVRDLAIDFLELLARYNQVILDRDRQRLELEVFYIRSQLQLEKGANDD